MDRSALGDECAGGLGAWRAVCGGLAGLVVASGLCAAGPVTQRAGFVSLYAGWSGGEPIFSTTSWWDSTSTAETGSTGYHLLAHSRVSVATNTVVTQTATSTMMVDATSYAYDGNWSAGGVDTSLRTFEVGIEKWHVFTNRREIRLWNLNAATTGLGSWEYAFLETGAWSQGVFTPDGGQIDLLTHPLGFPGEITLVPGAYRYQSKFDAVFEADEGFFLTQTTNWINYADIPAPGTMFVAVGGLFLRRRRVAG
ncbi:MAG: hypothetical protein KF757_03040 [Phycisphaeraceae bacterium]|nr:hypothetical protein [Phycisphaeraceae bacterium]MCW5762157.1 hypothetical protein [Phycisphaeraceae bacterium]